jgi:hypothetical protein
MSRNQEILKKKFKTKEPCKTKECIGCYHSSSSGGTWCDNCKRVAPDRFETEEEVNERMGRK